MMTPATKSYRWAGGAFPRTWLGRDDSLYATIEIGQGDYSKDRHEWLDKYTVEDIAKMVREKKATTKTGKKKK